MFWHVKAKKVQFEKQIINEECGEKKTEGNNYLLEKTEEDLKFDLM